LSRNLFVTNRWFEDPPMHVSATVNGDFMNGGTQKLGTNEMHLVAVVRMHDEFNRK
jgi:hypothetical protein